MRVRWDGLPDNPKYVQKRWVTKVVIAESGFAKRLDPVEFGEQAEDFPLVAHTRQSRTWVIAKAHCEELWMLPHESTPNPPVMSPIGTPQS